jgi:hypothetical protein
MRGAIPPLPPYFFMTWCLIKPWVRLHSNIILSSMPVYSQWSVPFRFPTKILCAFLISPIRAKVHKLWSSLLCSVFQPPATSSVLHPNLLIALFSDTLKLCSSHNVRPSVTPIVLCICNKLIFYAGKLLAPRPTPKLENNPLSAIRDCLFSIFAVVFRIWRPSPQSAMPLK